MPKANYPEPFVPTSFSCWITRTTATLKVSDRRTGERVIKREPRWEVEGRANGVQWAKRFKRAGLAEKWRDDLERGAAEGLAFDLKAKRFISFQVPDAPVAPAPVTVFDLTEAFYWSNPDWEPKTKILAAAAFNRARRFFVLSAGQADEADLAAVDDYLMNASFLPPYRGTALTERQSAGRQWLQQHSAGAGELTVSQIEAFVADLAVSQRDPDRRVAPATLVRYTQPLRACWSWAVSRDDVSVASNPWLAVRTPHKVKAKGASSMATGRPIAVDKDVVLDIPQAVALADCCGEVGSWGGVVGCYVLVMALCGLRPSEAVGLLWADVDLANDRSPGWLTVRRSRRRVSARWLDPDDDADWGPLKDRDLAETRRVPVHPLLVGRLAEHHRLFGPGPGGLVFHRNGRPFDLSMFSRDVWLPARATMFPPRTDIPLDDSRQPKLSRLRRHDLRHAACSWWLRSGVDATVCQRWSGHKSLSVFLDAYQGFAPGREDDGVRKLVASLA